MHPRVIEGAASTDAEKASCKRRIPFHHQRIELLKGYAEDHIEVALSRHETRKRREGLDRLYLQLEKPRKVDNVSWKTAESGMSADEGRFRYRDSWLDVLGNRKSSCHESSR